MPAQVVEVTRSGLNSGGGAVFGATLTLTAAPAPTDVLVLVYKTMRAAGARTVSSITGAGGATWSKVYTATRTEYWVSTDCTVAINTPPGSNALTITQSGAGASHAALYLIRGLGAPRTAAAGVVSTVTGTTATCPAQTTSHGQAHIGAALTVAAGTLTYPSASTGSWVTFPPQYQSVGETAPGQAGSDAYRITSAPASGSLSATDTVSGILELTSVVLGTETVPPPAGGFGGWGIPI